MRASVIAHVDLDAFFAAVEQRDDPSLKGKPVIVGADPKKGKGRGVVSTCSYEARRYGVHSAMPISIAYRKCSQAVFLPVNFRKYRKASKEVFRIFYDFTPHIEPISIDEAFLDITSSFHIFGTPSNVGLKIKKRIRTEVGITASVGIAPVKMVAKIASDHCKPDGLLEIKPGKVLEFLWALSIDRLWGIGPKMKVYLNEMGIKTIQDLAQTPVGRLEECFGEIGSHLHELANGIDERGVEADDEIKSVSREHTFEEDTDCRESVCRELLSLSEMVSRRLRKYELKGKTLTIKVRLKGFKTYTHARTFEKRTNHADIIYREAKRLFDARYSSAGTKIRLVGVRMTNFLDPYVRDSLFDDRGENRREKIHKAVDRIKDKFGEGSIHRGL